MSWDGYNFEDAIIISEQLVKNDTYTSIHIEEFEIEIRETKLGKEEFTRDIPERLAQGAVATSTRTASSASAPSCSRATSWSARCRRSRKSELTPEEKLLHAIFGRAGEDVKNDSLEVPSGVEGIVIDTQRFSRRASMTEDEKKAFDKEQKEHRKPLHQADRRAVPRADRRAVRRAGQKELKDTHHQQDAGGQDKDDKAVAEQAAVFKLDHLDIRSPEKRRSRPRRSTAGTRNGWSSCSTRRSGSSTR